MHEKKSKRRKRECSRTASAKHVKKSRSKLLLRASFFFFSILPSLPSFSSASLLSLTQQQPQIRQTSPCQTTNLQKKTCLQKLCASPSKPRQLVKPFRDRNRPKQKHATRFARKRSWSTLTAHSSHRWANRSWSRSRQCTWSWCTKAPFHRN